MKQRRSKSSIKWRCIFRFAFLLILGCIGCSKPPMFHVVARSERATEGERYKIFLKGRELGTVTGSGTFAFDADGRKGDTFQQMAPGSGGQNTLGLWMGKNGFLVVPGPSRRD